MTDVVLDEVTDAIFAADEFTAVIPNTEEIANLAHASPSRRRPPKRRQFH